MPSWCPGAPCYPDLTHNHCPSPSQGTTEKKKVKLTWSSWGRSSEMRCVLCCSIGESCHRTPFVNQPLAWACVSLASRPELRTYKETVCLLPEPGLHLVCTRFLQFPDECSGLSCWAGQRKPDPTPCQWSEGRCPASLLATCLCSSPPACLGALRGLVSACQAMKLERALSVTEATQPPALCWRLAVSTKYA